MDRETKCNITFIDQHQSEQVVIDVEETIMAESPEILVVPSFALN